MRYTVTLFVLGLFLLVGNAYAQKTDYVFNVPVSDSFFAPFRVGGHSGARGVFGPCDLDKDGKIEVLVTEYSGGGRVHVIENVGVDTWELVYSTPWADSTSSSRNGRYAVCGDLDGDGMNEIIFPSGYGYSATNPNVVNGIYKMGLWVYEYTGQDNNYGDMPAAIDDFEGGTLLPNRWIVEQMRVVDVDGDGNQEVLFPNNGNNAGDNWYIVSVTGDIGSGFEVWNHELILNSRTPVSRGGGSPYAILPADLDGDGTYELSLHSWNNFNFINGDVTGPDTYVFPDSMGYFHASSGDHVALFGGTVVDINGDGDDEVFYPNLYTGQLAVLNYEAGEDVLKVTADNLIFPLIDGPTALGITHGDMDNDGHPELIGAGYAYNPSNYMAGEPSYFVRIAEFNNKAGDNDPENPANYSVTDVETGMDIDTLSFDIVYRDSAGVKTKYYENHPGAPLFPAKLSYLGDPDNDGEREVAVSFQGVVDSVYVYDEVWQDTVYVRTLREARAVPVRAFMRVIASNGLTVRITDERVILPSDYVLSENYPNPFSTRTYFRYTLPINKTISVRVYDVTGRLVKTLVAPQEQMAGTYEVSWDGTNDAGELVANGTYFYTLEFGNFRQVRKMVLIR